MLLLFREKVAKKLFTVYRATLAALTLRLAGGQALHLSQRLPCGRVYGKFFLVCFVKQRGWGLW